MDEPPHPDWDLNLMRIRLVEPRDQVLEVAFEDAAGQRHDPVYLTVSPEPEKLTFVELDLSAVSAEGGDRRLRIMRTA